MEEASFMDFPRKLFHTSFGIGVDVGESAIKILYTSEVGDQIRVHFVTLPREKHEEAFSVLAEKCSGKLEPGQEVYTCGEGWRDLQKDWSERLGRKLSNILKVHTLVDGLLFMGKQLPWRQFVQTPSDKAVKVGVFVTSQDKMFLDAMETSPMISPSYNELHKYEEAGKRLIPITDESIHFPCLVCVIGSSATFIQISEDGTYQFCGSTSTAGRALLGLSSLLSDAKTFSEMCEMANKGDPTKVDAYTDDFAETVSDDDGWYSVVKDILNYKAFPFGHAVGKRKGDFQQADIISALVSLLAEDMSMDAFRWSIQLHVKQVFFVGGFACTNQLIQDEMACHFVKSRMFTTLNHVCDCYFVRNGQHCGAFGTLLRNLNGDSQ